MNQILIPLSNWLHALATVIFIGYFVLLAWIFLPVLSETGNGEALSKISKRSRLWMYASLLVFIVTGIYLMLVDPNYLGIGNFSNLWGVLMLIKHLLIVGMIAVGFWFNFIQRVGPSLRSNPGAPGFRRYVNIMVVSGMMLLLLTAIAQVE